MSVAGLVTSLAFYTSWDLASWRWTADGKILLRHNAGIRDWIFAWPMRKTRQFNPWANSTSVFVLGSCTTLKIRSQRSAIFSH